MLLLRRDLRQERDLRLIVCGAKPDLHDGVELRLPLRRVDRHKVIAKAEDLRLVVVFQDQVQDALEQVLHAGLSHCPGVALQLDLSAANRRGHRAGGRGLQRIGRQTHRRLRHAGPVFLHAVEVIHQRPDLAAHRCAGDLLNHTRLAGTDHATSGAVQKVIQIHLTLDRDHARQGRGVYAVEVLAHQRGLDDLQVFGQVVDRATDQAVRHQDRRADREGHVIPRLIVQDVVTVRANRADAPTLGNAVSVEVHVHDALVINHRAQGRVSRVNAGRRLKVLEAVVDLAVGVEFVLACVLLDDVAVVTHRHKLGYGHRRAVRDEVTFVQRHGVTRDEELLGRHVDCLNLARFTGHPDRQVILHVERDFHAVLVNH